MIEEEIHLMILKLKFKNRLRNIFFYYLEKKMKGRDVSYEKYVKVINLASQLV